MSDIVRALQGALGSISGTVSTEKWSRCERTERKKKARKRVCFDATVEDASKMKPCNVASEYSCLKAGDSTLCGRMGAQNAKMYLHSASLLTSVRAGGRSEWLTFI